MRYWVTNCILIGMAVCFLIHFSLIAVYKQLLIDEPHTVILGLEMALMVGVISLGIFNIINYLRLERR